MCIRISYIAQKTCSTETLENRQRRPFNPVEQLQLAKYSLVAKLRPGRKNGRSFSSKGALTAVKFSHKSRY